MKPAGPLDLQHAVMRAADLTATERLMLMVLVDRADSAGLCYPSITLMAKQASTSKRSVHRTLDRLKRRGLVIWDSGVGRGHTNVYRLVLSSITTLRQIGDTASPFPENSDTDTPFREEEKVTQRTIKGDKSDNKRCHSVTQKENKKEDRKVSIKAPPKKARQAVRTSGRDYDLAVFGGHDVT